jgi:hypothetical protein
MLKFFLAIAVAMTVQAGTLRADAKANDPSTYILFLHTGAAAGHDTAKVVTAVTSALLKAGYSLRAPDTERDIVGGPGVDYFDDGDAQAAAEVAKAVNSAAGADFKLAPRLQRAKTPSHYIGIWLF